jgi:metal-responsive CopG/Arc/MetJ family transcriptional regulator
VPTTIHVPDELLERVDARAKALGLSRNRFIVEALEKSLGVQEGWSPELVRMLTTHTVSRAAARELEGSMAHVYATRRSKRRPPKP